MKHELRSRRKAEDKEAVKAEIEEAKEFYAILQSTVEKRDAANGTTMVDAIAGYLTKSIKRLKPTICLHSARQTSH